MSSVSYDNPHHHPHPSTTKSTINAGTSGEVLLRGGGGGGGGEGVAGVGATGVIAANGVGDDGVRIQGGEAITPSPGFPVGVTAVNGGTARRAVMVNRQSTGRYAYSSNSNSAGAGRDGAGRSRGVLRGDGNVSGGGGGAVGVVGVARTPPTPSSHLLSEAKEL